LVASSFFDTTLIESDSLGVYANHLKLPGSMKAFARTASRVFVDDPREQIWADLSKVNIPVLILWGERDRVIPVANGHMLKEKIPDSRLIVFPLCGHMPQEEQPRETTAAILQFLEETP
jgi:pimeloyl-ACP methyl ester carboxylesterase